MPKGNIDAYGPEELKKVLKKAGRKVLTQKHPKALSLEEAKKLGKELKKKNPNMR